MTARKRSSLADLRLNDKVQCIYGHVASSAGAVKFRAHHVCAECTARLKAKEVQAATA